MKRIQASLILTALLLASPASATITINPGTDGTAGPSGAAQRDATTISAAHPSGQTYCSQSAAGAIITWPSGAISEVDNCASITMTSALDIMPAASTSAPGVVQIGTGALQCLAGNTTISVGAGLAITTGTSTATSTSGGVGSGVTITAPGYATTGTLTNYATTASVTSTLTNYVLTSTLTNYVTTAALTNTLTNYVGQTDTRLTNGRNATNTYTLVFPNATKTISSATATATVTQADIATVTPSASTIPMAKTNSTIDVAWIQQASASQYGTTEIYSSNPAVDAYAAAVGTSLLCSPGNHVHPAGYAKGLYVNAGAATVDSTAAATPTGAGQILQTTAAGTMAFAAAPTVASQFAKSSAANTWAWGAMSSADVTGALTFTPLNPSSGVTGTTAWPSSITHVGGQATAITAGADATTTVHGLMPFSDKAKEDAFTGGATSTAAPRAPVLVGTATGLGTNPYSVFVAGRYAYTANFGNASLSVIDVSTPSAPVLVGTATGLGAQPAGVFVAGRYAYTANLGNTSLSVIDVSTPSAPVLVGTATGLGAQPAGVFVAGRYAYTANLGNTSLSVIDVSTPSAPVLVGTATGLGAQPYSVFVAGRYAYTANFGNASLSVIDLFSGLVSPTAEISSLRAGFVSIDSNEIVAGDISVEGGAHVGRSLLVDGPVAASNIAGTPAPKVTPISDASSTLNSWVTSAPASSFVSSGSNVAISSTAPTGANMSLVTTDATHATWQTISAGLPPPLYTLPAGITITGTGTATATLAVTGGTYTTTSVLTATVTGTGTGTGTGTLTATGTGSCTAMGTATSTGTVTLTRTLTGTVTGTSTTSETNVSIGNASAAAALVSMGTAGQAGFDGDGTLTITPSSYGAVMARFGGSGHGISIDSTASLPGIGFNAEQTKGASSWKYGDGSSAQYGGFLQFSPGNGTWTINSSNAPGYDGGLMTSPALISITRAGVLSTSGGINAGGFIVAGNIAYTAASAMVPLADSNGHIDPNFLPPTPLLASSTGSVNVWTSSPTTAGQACVTTGGGATASCTYQSVLVGNGVSGLAVQSCDYVNGQCTATHTTTAAGTLYAGPGVNFTTGTGTSTATATSCVTSGNCTVNVTGTATSTATATLAAGAGIGFKTNTTTSTFTSCSIPGPCTVLQTSTATGTNTFAWTNAKVSSGNNGLTTATAALSSSDISSAGGLVTNGFTGGVTYPAWINYTNGQITGASNGSAPISASGTLSSGYMTYATGASTIVTSNISYDAGFGPLFPAGLRAGGSANLSVDSSGDLNTSGYISAYSDISSGGDVSAAGNLSGASLTIGGIPATATPTPNAIVKANGSGKLDGWLSHAVQNIVSYGGPGTDVVTSGSTVATVISNTATAASSTGHILITGTVSVDVSPGTTCNVWATVNGSQSVVSQINYLTEAGQILNVALSGYLTFSGGSYTIAVKLQRSGGASACTVHSTQVFVIGQEYSN